MWDWLKSILVALVLLLLFGILFLLSTFTPIWSKFTSQRQLP